MWNPNSGVAPEESRKDVSISDKSLAQSWASSSSASATSSDKSQCPSQQGTLLGGGVVDAGGSSADVKLFEQESQSCDVDSGFLSGPQLSGYDDSEYGVAGDNGGGEGSSQGSHDSQPASERVPFKKQITVVEATQPSASSILDSGLEVDVSASDIQDASTEQSSSLHYQQQQTATPKATHMILENKIDAGLTEWFCNLTLKNADQQPLNNLGCPDAQTTAAVVVSSSGSSSGSQQANVPDDRNKQPWEIYYRQNEDGDTQLHIACITGYAEVVAALIRLAPHPCLLDIQNDGAQTALHLAVMAGHRDIVRMLLVAGAEATMRDHNGNTPLHLACISGHMDCVRALTTPITATEIQESSKNLLLARNDKSTFRRCTQLPPDLEQRNYDGERCVHLAAQNSHIDILRHLVWFGADINAKEGRSGKTPLHIAIERCNEVLANFLLGECHKLNLEAETYAGLTAYQLATANHHEQIALGLEKHGAEPLTPPESDQESDDEDSQKYDRFGDPGYFVSYNSGTTINVA